MKVFATMFSILFVSGSIVTTTSAFSNPSITKIHQGRHHHEYHFIKGPRTTSTLQMVVDPTLMNFAIDAIDIELAVELSVAMAGAATAGVLSQTPKIQKLEQQVEELKLLLENKEEEMYYKIKLLEDKLFTMDQEFEEQTTRFQKRYDLQQKQKIEQIKNELKQQFQYKLEIQLKEQQSKKLTEQLDKESTRTLKQEELTQLKLKQSQMEDMNQQLELALQSAQDELEHFREATLAKKKFLFF